VAARSQPPVGAGLRCTRDCDRSFPQGPRIHDLLYWAVLQFHEARAVLQFHEARKTSVFNWPAP
jgi:hypothetical protein